MKQLFFYCLTLLGFLLSAMEPNAQSVKLHTAYYFSSGIVVDSKGKVFVTGKNNKIIKITPQGKSIHLIIFK